MRVPFNGARSRTLPRIRPPARCTWALHAVALLAPALAVAQSVANQRIVDIIADLRRQGLTIIYSSELVGVELRARQEVTTSDPLERLRQVLAPYGLAIEAGPRGSWLVVRSDPTDTPQAPANGEALATFTVAPPTIEEVVVSASRYSISRDPSTSTSLIDRVQLDNTPTLAEDALRVMHSLPGLTSSGLTAQVNVRGGTTNEGLLFLDGVQLLNPFHLKDFQSLFSGINPSIVDTMTVYTGAFPAQFGDRMS
ncbi:MAG TPA: Plug domain-containing protein, partial [Gammaproteobacteria bacterium]|nr:Plug domain-containing protein [Gammaproteobacteria bacterium]